MNRLKTSSAAAALIAATISLTMISSALAETLFTQSNAAAGNQIQIFVSAPDGSITQRDPVATGGTGTGGGLGNQGALAFAQHGRILLAVNAGSNDVSAFAVNKDKLTLIGRTPSGGVRPVSIAVDDDLVYVLNAGGSGNVAGFRLSFGGKLTPIANASRPLSGAATTNAAQVGFNREGSTLVVTERATNNIVAFPVDYEGKLGAPVINTSNGRTPFGFEFTRRDTLLVSEAFGGAANGSALSSYDLDDENGKLEVVTGSAPTGQTAACWVATARGGRFAYVTNTGSGTITGYSVDRTGALRRLGDNGATASVGGGPTDAYTEDRFLFVISPSIGQIVSFSIGSGGALVKAGSSFGLSTSATGLVAQ